MTDLFSALVSQFSEYTFGEKHTVRVMPRDGEPWFVATDVCTALDYKNTSDAIATHLDADERYSQSLERGGSLVLISESGLYALVLRSRKPEARKFAKWVTSEVLPSIRKTGGYQKPANMAKALAAANEVAAQMQAAVFDAILSGNSNWKIQRAMVSFNVGPAGALTPRVDLIEHEAIVMTLPHLAKAIVEPGGMLPSNSELANLAAACNKRLAQRLEFVGSRDALNNG